MFKKQSFNACRVIFFFTRRLAEKIENSPTGFSVWFFSFFSIVTVRVLIENWLGALSENDLPHFFYHFSYNFLFFLFTYLLFVLLIKKVVGITLKQASNIMLWGYLIILTPPITDYVISGGKGFVSFYGIHGLSELISRFFTFFGDRPEVGVTYGVRIEIALAVISLFAYGIIKTKKMRKALTLSLSAYVLLFILGTFPSWITIILKGPAQGFLSVTEMDIAQMFLSPARIFSQEIGSFLNALSIKLALVYSLLIALLALGIFYLNFREKFVSFAKNARPPQLFYHWGLLFAGAGLGIFFSRIDWEMNLFNIIGLLIVIISVGLSWVSSVTINDLFDKKIDEITNTSRPLIMKIFSREEYAGLGLVLLLSSLFLSSLVNFKISMLLLAYNALAWAYSAWPLRLKRFAYISTFVSAIASILILFSGFILVSPDQNISNLPFSIITLLVISYTISLPLKDLKDIEGDKKDGVYTVPVIFGEDRGRIIIASGIFISYVLSVVFLHEFNLFRWAILFGGISFWTVISSRKKGKINYRNIFWYILGLVLTYGIIIVKVAF